jgi:hypothetical protein
LATTSISGKQRGLPLNKTDGKRLTIIPRQQIASNVIQIDLPFNEANDQHIKLFFANENDSNKYRLFIQ